MGKRIRKFMTLSKFNSLRDIARKKLIEAKNNLLNCIYDCSISLCSSNLKSLELALGNYNVCLFEFRFPLKIYLRDKQLYLSLKSKNLLLQEEINLYDNEFSD